MNQLTSGPFRVEDSPPVLGFVQPNLLWFRLLENQLRYFIYNDFQTGHSPLEREARNVLCKGTLLVIGLTKPT